MNVPQSRSELDAAKRIVVKIGSSSLTDVDGYLDLVGLEKLVRALAHHSKDGHEVVLVSSGAQAAAMRPLGLKHKPKDLATAQAAASVGQGLLIAEYSRAFKNYGLNVGQVLLTAEDILRRSHYTNGRRALERLLSAGVFPIVNENDAVATDELTFGDNDRLAALVAHLVGADALILLTDVDALYTAPPANPEARVVREVYRFSEVEDLNITARGSEVGTGGMVTKIQAAAIATSSGIPVLLTNAELIEDVFEGATVGTWFHPTGRRLAPRQLWLAYAAEVRGRIVIDEGAAAALVRRHASLLPAGIIGSEGKFRSGDVVEIVTEKDQVIARGLSSFSSARITEVAGKSMEDIEHQLGPAYAHVAVHRDELVVMARHRRIPLDTVD